VDSEEFGPVFSVPDTDIVHGGSGKDIRVVVGEGNIVDSVGMGSVSDLSKECIRGDPVDIGLLKSVYKGENRCVTSLVPAKKWVKS